MRSAMAALAVFLVSLLPVWAIYAKEPGPAPTWASWPRPAQAITAPTPQATARQTAPAAVIGPFLPVILTSTRVTPIVFTGSVTSDCQGSAGISFAYGIKYLCVDLTVDGAQGQAYRFSWTIDGKPQANLGNSGTISSQLVGVGDGICYGLGGACGDAIPRGTYQVSFFLNNVQYQANAAVIR
jgi:hypothetical protein